MAGAARNPWRTGRLVPRGRSGSHRRSAHRRRIPHARDDAGCRLRHLPLRRPEQAAVGRSQLAITAGPPLGWRQHRRLLLHVPRRPEAAIPDQRQQGRQRLLLGDRLQRAVARRVVGPDRRDHP